MTIKQKAYIAYYTFICVVYFYFNTDNIIVNAQNNIVLHTIRVFWPLLFLIPIFLPRKYRHRYPVILVILFIGTYTYSEKVRNEVQEKYLLQNDFYIATAKYRVTINRGSRYDKANFDHYSIMQYGGDAELYVDESKHLYDTVLVKISYKYKFCGVYEGNPSPAEIQKYMEPVLFIDGVEQPRPEYDDLKLSDEERRDLLREHHIEVARVVKKERDKFLRNLVTLQVNDTIQKTVNLMYKDEPDYDDIFDSLNEESYVLVKVSDINPKVIEVTNWQPTAKDVDKYNVKSYLMLATVISKKSVDDNKQRKHSIIYYAKLRINDKMETSFIRVRGMFQSDYQVYESLKVGDPVMIKLTEGKTKTVDVLNWHPTPEQIEKYKTPVRVKERNK